MPEKTFPSLYVTENSDTTTRREDDGMVDDKSKELSLSKLECRSHCSGAYEKVSLEQFSNFTFYNINKIIYVGTYTSARMCTSTRPCSVLFKNEFTSIV